MSFFFFLRDKNHGRLGDSLPSFLISSTACPQCCFTSFLWTVTFLESNFDAVSHKDGFLVWFFFFFHLDSIVVVWISYLNPFILLPCFYIPPHPSPSCSFSSAPFSVTTLFSYLPMLLFLLPFQAYYFPVLPIARNYCVFKCKEN